MKKLIGYLGLGAIVVAGSLFGYKIATDNEFSRTIDARSAEEYV